MAIIERIKTYHADMTAWRRDIHAHPETAFEEVRTAEVVAQKLESFGIEVHRGLAKTGVVGTLKAGTGNRAIGLRADMDALDLDELNGFAHKSKHAGKMHACGHDGHTVMLLGAAKYLAETRNFDGTVYFIFQPAEENEGGGRVMVQEGLFEKFPVEAVYGMHNYPSLPVGVIAVRSGPMMASFDKIDIHIRGKGAHAARPHDGVDPIVVAANFIQTAQTLVSRVIDPIQPAVLSFTRIEAGHTYNVIPETAHIGGTVRAFSVAVQDRIERGLRELAAGLGAAMGADIKVTYDRRYPPLVNSDEETEIAARAAAAVVGAENVLRHEPPVMGSEDFAWMLLEKPGSYVWIGQGGEGSCMVHNPHYDFNDDILPLGASYWATLVEQTLPAGK